MVLQVKKVYIISERKGCPFNEKENKPNAGNFYYIGIAYLWNKLC